MLVVATKPAAAARPILGEPVLAPGWKSIPGVLAGRAPATARKPSFAAAHVGGERIVDAGAQPCVAIQSANDRLMKYPPIPFRGVI